ncbi:AAA family ATPase [Actinoplanes sp. NPDC051513]|uniref:AAA family ATPase n=1 Tax=Actinoplanes sp. NPDC051513 TaxID=3363908 RepID=UPI00378AAC82
MLPKLDGVRPSGGGYMARCPVHDDSSASLSLSVGKDHPVVMHCHAGCQSEDVLAALGLDWEAVTRPRDPQVDDRIRQPRRDGRPFGIGGFVAQYDYADEQGNLLFQVLRTADKKFRQRRPDPAAKDGWTWSLGDTRRVLYRLPEVIEAVKDGNLVYIAEGEKDVENIRKAGYFATCNPGGAGKWRPEYSEFFRDAYVTIFADKDAPGQEHARKVRDSLLEVGALIEVVEGKAGKDASDHLAAGFAIDDVEITWTNDKPATPVLAPDLDEFLAVEDQPYEWLVEGLLERGDRIILTGFEGLGKSVLARQMAICIAAGVHPFKHAINIPPRRVLVIDCENSEQQNRRKYRELRDIAHGYGLKVEPGMWRIIHRTDGIDLTTREDAEWLLERVTAHQPDLLVIGPFYRLHNANINEEGPARATVAVLDKARVAANCAMLIEAHAGHGEQGLKRSVRPTGSSLLMRWPEFGIGIVPCGTTESGGALSTVEVRHWRGQRDQREWPNWLTWGDPGKWPWKIALGSPQDAQRQKRATGATS